MKLGFAISQAYRNVNPPAKPVPASGPDFLLGFGRIGMFHHLKFAFDFSVPFLGLDNSFGCDAIRQFLSHFSLGNTCVHIHRRLQRKFPTGPLNCVCHNNSLWNIPAVPTIKTQPGGRGKPEFAVAPAAVPPPSGFPSGQKRFDSRPSSYQSICIR